VVVGKQGGQMIEIETRGQYGSIIGNDLLIDEKDHLWLNSYIWYVSKHDKKYYVHTYIKEKLIYVHRLLLGLKYDDKQMVDHIDGNPLNNQRSNLRLCDSSQNGANRTKSSTTLYKGVFKNSKGNYYVRIGYQNKALYLGSYVDPKIAAMVYDKKAIELFGSFANLNFPDEDYSNFNPPTTYDTKSNVGYRNISYNSKIDRYIVEMTYKGKTINRNKKTLEEALVARDEIRKILHGNV